MLYFRSCFSHKVSFFIMGILFISLHSSEYKINIPDCVLDDELHLSRCLHYPIEREVLKHVIKSTWGNNDEYKHEAEALEKGLDKLISQTVKNHLFDNK